MNKKVIIGVLIAAIFVMVSFVPVANATTNTNQNINAVTSDVSHHNNNFNNQEINVVKYNYSSNMTSNNIHINMVFSTNNTCNPAYNRKWKIRQCICICIRQHYILEYDY